MVLKNKQLNYFKEAIMILPVCCHTGPSSGGGLTILNVHSVLCETWQTSRLPSTTLQEVLKEALNPDRRRQRDPSESQVLKLVHTCPLKRIDVPEILSVATILAETAFPWRSKPLKHCSLPDRVFA